MNLLKHLSGLKTFVERHPALWSRAWRLMHTSSLFLPHDQTYYALKHLAKGDVNLILDIGANQGISALSFRKLCPHYQIISFEPNTAHERNLKEVQRRISNYSYHMVGLGDQPGEFTLYTPLYKNVYLHTASALDQKTVREGLDLYPPAIRSGIQIVPAICQIRTLDEFQLKPQIIKIDAEGHEAKVLLGAQETLKTFQPALIFEACHADLSEIIRMLCGFGYDILSYDPKKDFFTPFNPSGGGAYLSSLRNLIAVSKKQKEELVLQGVA